jgi:predicted peroxiredoxin
MAGSASMSSPTPTAGATDEIPPGEREPHRVLGPGVAEGVACDGCPPLERLAQYAEAGGRLLVCPICFSARKLSTDDLLEHAEIGGATPLWEWIGDGAMVFSY